MKKASRPPPTKTDGLAMVEEAIMNQFSSTDGNVTINVADFLKLVNSASAHSKAEEKKPSPVPWQVVSLDVRTEATTSCVSFTCDFLVRSFTHDWVNVPLLPAQYALDKFSVSAVEAEDAGDSTEATGQTGRDASEREVDRRNPSVVNNVSSGELSVLLPFAGDYNVSISGLAPFENERKCGFRLNFKPDVLRSSLTCLVPNVDLDINVDPALSTTLEELAPNPPHSTVKSTRVTCLLGSSKTLSVQWTAKQPEEVEEVGDNNEAEDATLAAVEEVKKEPLIVVNHTAVHSIGEGVVATSLSLEYIIHHTTKGVFDILCPASTNIIDVSGSNIKRWKVLHGPNAAPGVPVAERAESLSVEGLDAEIISVSEGGSAAAGPAAPNTLQLQAGQKAVRVMLHYPVSGKYSLSVSADVPMESTSCAVALPAFDAVGANRQKGWVGVEARTNVEVREVKKSGVARVDVSELPADMARGGKAFLHAYKFLMARYSVELDVKRHADAEVLTAVIEEAWLTATVSEAGSSLSRVLLVLRNTQRQFLRITLPDRRAAGEAGAKKADLWSAMVNGEAVKPAVDAENTVLIPLLKAAPDSDSGAVLYVELVFLEAVPAMGKTGKLALSFSRFDLPVQRMFLTTFLPTNFDYGQFEGDLKEVQQHAKPPPTVRKPASGGRPPRPTRAPFRRGQQSNVLLQNNDSLSDDSGSLGSSVEEERRRSLTQVQSNFMLQEEIEEAVEAAESALDRGVVPVAISAMQEGTAFCFERLLVQNEAYSIAVPYTKRNVVVRNTSNLASKCAIM